MLACLEFLCALFMAGVAFQFIRSGVRPPGAPGPCGGRVEAGYNNQVYLLD